MTTDLFAPDPDRKAPVAAITRAELTNWMGISDLPYPMPPCQEHSAAGTRTPKSGDLW